MSNTAKYCLWLVALDACLLVTFVQFLPSFPGEGIALFTAGILAGLAAQRLSRA